MTTDPFTAHDPLICGLSISTDDPISCSDYGSIGCYVTVAGTAAINNPTNPMLSRVAVASGDYLLTCSHVVRSAMPRFDRGTNILSAPGRIIQPGRIQNNQINNYVIGAYVAGYDFAAVGVDVALVSVASRGMRNVVPAAPWNPFDSIVGSIGTAQVGDDVLKFGATTKHTKGRVTAIDWNSLDGTIVRAIVIEGTDGPWIKGGDSGSVIVRELDKAVVGLVFRVDNSSGNDTNGYGRAFAYDFNSQLEYFGGGSLYESPLDYR